MSAWTSVGSEEAISAPIVHHSAVRGNSALALLQRLSNKLPQDFLIRRRHKVDTTVSLGWSRLTGRARSLNGCIEVRLILVFGKFVMPPPEVSIIVTTFERPWHLEHCLRSLALQNQALEHVEIIVADDGSSGDATINAVAEFAGAYPGDVVFLTQPKQGFRLSASRNRAIACARSTRLIFLDGDCVVPPWFVKSMVARLRNGVVIGGDCHRLTQGNTELLTAEKVNSWEVGELVSSKERFRLRKKTIRAVLYSMLRLPMRPRLTGCAFAATRADLLDVNGFDENYVGWGYEDRDLQCRLFKHGTRVVTSLDKVKAVHLWHPLDPSHTKNGLGTQNRRYFERADIRPYCERGVDQHRRHEIPSLLFSSDSRQPDEDEIRFLKELQAASEITRLEASGNRMLAKHLNETGGRHQ